MEDTSNLTSNMTSSVIEELSIDIDPDDFIGNLIKDDEVRDVAFILITRLIRIYSNIRISFYEGGC